MNALKLVTPDYKSEEFNISDYDFNFDNEENSPKSICIVIPEEVEIMRNKGKDDRILKAYAQRTTGLNNITVTDVYYNRDFKLEIEVAIS